MKSTFVRKWCILSGACLMATAGVRADDAPRKSFADSAELTLDQLVNIQVTSVSKKETDLSQSPAAISVITQEDIRRLGITTIPDALRLVPGLDVARINGSQWAISSRGFNSQYANKMLVLMDGRSIYTPSFGGVQWDVQDLVMEDLERIEVIRGPGATLWGANAVNGVINITSKNSRDTQGVLASTSAGTEDQPSTTLRYGGELATNLHYRVYAKYFNRDGLVDSSGNDAPDAWRSIRGGFRADWEPTTENLVTVQGDYYSLHSGENMDVPQLTPPFNQNVDTSNFSRGGNLLGRWTETFSDMSHLSLQAYYDYYRHESGLVIETRNTADIQLEHQFQLGGWNNVMWGLGYRFSADNIRNSPVVTWFPNDEDLSLYNTFIQDEMTLVPDRLHLTFGSKFEHNDYTGWEIQPGTRLLWTPTERQTVWASISRAVSTPARYLRGSRLDTAGFNPPASPLFEVAIFGNSGVVSEAVTAYELGYRIEPTRNLSFDVAAFYNVYDHLVGETAGTPQFEVNPAPPHVLIPLNFQNSSAGDTYGTELTAQWQPVDYWRLTANYSWLQMRVHPDDLFAASPQYQASLRSYLTLPGNLELNAAAYYVDQIAVANKVGTLIPVPAYVRLDAGVVWHPTPPLEIGIWGQNLLESRHFEFLDVSTTLQTEVPRGVLGKITWRL